MLWFKHMSASHNDSKLASIRTDFGMWGLAVYWDLVGRVALQYDPRKGNTKLSIPVEELCGYYSCRRRKLSSYLLASSQLELYNAVVNGLLVDIDIPKIPEIMDNASRNLQAEEKRVDKKRTEKNTTPQKPPDMSIFGEHETLITDLIDDLKKQAPQPVKDTWIKTMATKIANQPREVVAIQARKFLDDYGGTGKGIGYFMAMVKNYHAGADKNKAQEPDEDDEPWERGVWARDKHGNEILPGR